MVAILSILWLASGNGWWDVPEVRACCSGADAVYADDWHTQGDHVIVTVTGEGPSRHPWAPIGRSYDITPDKIGKIGGNPTGHGILFLNPVTLNSLCFFPGPGI